MSDYAKPKIISIPEAPGLDIDAAAAIIAAMLEAQRRLVKSWNNLQRRVAETRLRTLSRSQSSLTIGEPIFGVRKGE